jgi:hypothetical protein
MRSSSRRLRLETPREGSEKGWEKPDSGRDKGVTKAAGFHSGRFIGGPGMFFWRSVVIIIGIVLMLIGFIVGIPVLWTLGIISLVVGLVLMALGSAGRAIGGRRHYW